MLAPLAMAAVVSGLAPNDVTAPQSSPTPIVGGEPTEPGEFDTVVAVVTEKLCTGVVVAPRLVLTAGHCIEESTVSPQVRHGDEMHANPPIESVQVGVHPDFCPIHVCGEELYDYGYVVLAGDFPATAGFTAPIVHQPEWDEVMVEGHEVTLVGYGADQANGELDDGTGLKRKAVTPIQRSTENGLEFFAGDGYRDTCGGDSGGPAIARLQDGTMRIAGITSRGAHLCGAGGYYGAPFPALCWLRDETGVDLLDGQCCDCLDMAPPDQGGCSVGARGSAGGSLVLVVLLGTLRRRARR